MPAFDLNNEEITELLRRFYGLKVGEIERLHGCYDLNLRLKIDPVQQLDRYSMPSHLDNGEVLLKVASGSNNLPLEIQCDLLSFLNQSLPELRVPQVLPSLSGKRIENIQILRQSDIFNDKGSGSSSSQTEVSVRLLTYIPGVIIGNDGPRKFTTSLLVEMGEVVGRLSKALQNFAYNQVPLGENVPWSLENVGPKLDPYLTAVDNPCQLNMFRQIIQEFKNHLENCRNYLDRGIVHGDLHESNIVMEETKLKDGKEELHVKGVIDFEDVHVTFTVFELVVAIAEAMSDSENQQSVPSLEAGGYLLAGYLRHKQLSKREIEFLKIAVEARIVLGMVMSKYISVNEQPDNEYILCTQKCGWALLKKLRVLNSSELSCLWNKILTNVLDAV